MTTNLPSDNKGAPLPCLGFHNTFPPQHIAYSSSTVRSLAFDPSTRVVTIIPTSDCYFKQGDATVVATTADHFWPAGVPVDISVGGGPVTQRGYIAVIRSTADGTLHISERV